MSRLEVLCVTMHQKDFSIIEKMNIHANVVFANQCDHTSYDEFDFEGHTAKMISTQTRGVGINRNMTLTYATADICLLADDDVIYNDNLEQIVVSEFENHPDADVFIFHLDSNDSVRTLKKFSKTHHWNRVRGLPFGGVRIAFRLSAVRKANVWFSTLFGGGCQFSSGEDSIFLTDLRRAGLRFYVSKETIGSVSFAESSWFKGYDTKFYYGKGAFYQAIHPRTKYAWMLYFLLRTHNKKEVKAIEKLKWMKNGMKGYMALLSYEQFCSKYN